MRILTVPRLLIACLALLGMLVASGCKTQHVVYHSTADVPYFTDATATQMELVRGEGSDAGSPSERDYIVFAAVDNQGDGYVLLAPHTGSSPGPHYSFANASLRRAVPLQGENLNTLIAGLSRTAALWSDQSAGGEGAFFEFVHAPEQDVRQISENVVEWRPAIRFTFSKVPDGPTARMLLGDAPSEQLQHVIEFDERSQIKDFQYVLEAARTRAQSLASG